MLSCDPTKRRTGGALLGDRIRMNAVHAAGYMRSFASRGSEREVPESLRDAIPVAGRPASTSSSSRPGLGQADSAITGFADVSLYVMTAE